MKRTEKNNKIPTDSEIEIIAHTVNHSGDNKAKKNIGPISQIF